MKTVMIHGQNHKGRILAEKLTDEENTTEFFLPRNLPHYCVGCYSCIEDEAKCPYWNEKKVNLDAMEQPTCSSSLHRTTALRRPAR